MIARWGMGAVRWLDPETAHRRTIDLLAVMPAGRVQSSDPCLAVSLCGIDFAHPVGLAAGFDKDARAAHAMARFGFATAEVGTLTPLAQAGNPRPRLFRLSQDRAVINRMGFNNGGQGAAIDRLIRMRAQPGHLPIGVNIGANKDAADRVADYVSGLIRMAPYADWLTANISSPNTPGLRALQDEGALDALLSALAAARGALSGGGPPLFLKVAPDLDPAQIDGVVRSCMTYGIDAIIIGNTTISRPPLNGRDAGQAGGLSGAPLAPLALQRLRDFRVASGGAIPLIAAGGIASGADVWARLAAGATLVQLYSALVYHGPWLAKRIVADLATMMARAGVGSIHELIDSDNAGH